MSIEMQELLPQGVSLDEIPEDHQKNLLAFLPKLQAFREKVGIPMVCSSGYRTLEHHEEIYHIKNEKRIQAGLVPVAIPMSSQHLFGHAADFLDHDRKLADFVDANPEFVRSLGFYFEARDATDWPNPWLHIQDVPPRSGKLWFEP